MVLFLLGIAASIPLSILANLLTPKWQAFWSQRSEAARSKQDQLLQNAAQTAEWFAANPVAFQSYLLHTVLETLSHLFAAAVGVTLAATLLLNIDRFDEPASLGSRAVYGLMLLFSMGFASYSANWAVGRIANARRVFVSVRWRSDWPVNARMTEYAVVQRDVEPEPEPE